MSILIKGAKIPKNCGYCFFNDFNICQVGYFTVADAVYHEERHENCPLVEIPSHGDLIDKGKLVNVLFDLLDDSDKPVHDMLLEVETAPTVIESEVEK